ncbi:glutamate--cysteine ligase [Leptolyngbya cf. ectocarpi LEGE 11479]|uniref:Glutamate--cysteine ligase n=1 Tax=Leptolyngbya cf. ectocarpi LEGE 11479 TaxID=1828722 RepID=A0A928X0G7_LEPEC|nr:glutamate--cysteine ligase [Leptolyngbya ectocarpi]MBE9065586.1 glutamate--cysteine ligase [Leptolyngbya cf. ectocarpi LEGE 11479]
MLLSKGFEVEIYTGLTNGEIIGLSDKIVKSLSGFVREPDSRNVEYTTPPLSQYEQLLCELVSPRRRLRHFLKGLGPHYTLIPGSTLSTGNSDIFYRSDPQNPYHAYIENTYGTDVVTASIHINLGINDPELLMRACRLVRAEAPLILALSASSPFLDNQITGYHSTRWHLFPQTPKQVPLFESHEHFIKWTEAQLQLGTMQNVRHLWVSVRPNGDCRPYNLNRLELRISDLVTDPLHLLAITAFLEARLLQLQQNPSLDPLVSSQIPAGRRHEELLNIIDENEKQVAKASLNAQLRHWYDGEPINATDWITQIYNDVLPIAKAHGIACFLTPIKQILREGNQAQNWLKQIETGMDIPQVMAQTIQIMERQEQALQSDLCQPA